MATIFGSCETHLFCCPFSVQLAADQRLGITSTATESEVGPICYYYLQLELCEQTLTQWLRPSNRSAADVQKAFREIVTAVSHVHDEKLLHRDIKPENILFSADGSVRLGDFGLATQFNVRNVDRNVVGTGVYIAPEVIHRGRCSYKSDMYSVGVVLLQMLYRLTDVRELENDVVKANFGQLPDKSKLIHAGLLSATSWVLKLLSYNPDYRPTSQDLRLKHINFFDMQVKDFN